VRQRDGAAKWIFRECFASGPYGDGKGVECVCHSLLRGGFFNA